MFKSGLEFYVLMTMLMKPIKILIVKFRHIGDVLLSTPLIENLKYHYPVSVIDYALNDDCQSVVAYSPLISNIIPYYRNVKKKNFFSRLIAELQFIWQIRRKRYDMVINLTEGDRGAIIALCSGATIKLGISLRNPVLKLMNIYTNSLKNLPILHAIERDLLFLRLLGKEVVYKRVSIFWLQQHEDKINQILEHHRVCDFVLVHPVARWQFKCWDDQHVAELIDYLIFEKSMQVVVTASSDPSELTKIQNILSYCRSNPINLSGFISLNELSYLAKKAIFFLGVDTAPMHIAAAVNTPVIALFGHSMQVFWGPWDNDLFYSTYTTANKTCNMGKHCVIQHGHGVISREGQSAISSSIMKITTVEVKEKINNLICSNYR